MTRLLSDEQAGVLGAALHAARRDRVAVAPLSDAFPGMGVEDAYAVQQALVSLLQRDGETIVGYKLGLTSAPMQALLGVDQPDFGPVFASGVLADGAVIDAGAFIAPRIEAEIAVILGEDLSGPHCTPAEAARAATGLVASMEIVDSRIIDWRITLADTIADLASGGAITLGSRVIPLEGVDPRLVGMVLTRNGELLATGAGAAALGDPMAAVAWLANTLAPLGAVLPAGSIVMTGALHAMVPIRPGDVFRADFDRLGPVTVRIAGGDG